MINIKKNQWKDLKLNIHISQEDEKEEHKEDTQSLKNADDDDKDVSKGIVPPSKEIVSSSKETK